jgi:transcriptional regulator with XRE-family HTH domain
MLVHVSNIDPNPEETPGQFVKRLLAALGETKSSAARKTGVHNTLIGKWQNDEIDPGLKNARKFADGLNLPRFVVMIGLKILEPADATLDPAIADLAGAFALLPEGAERDRAREQIRFIAAMARDKSASIAGESVHHRDAS